MRPRDVAGVREDVAVIVARSALQDDQRVDITERSGVVVTTAAHQAAHSEQRGPDRDALDVLLHGGPPHCSEGPIYKLRAKPNRGHSRDLESVIVGALAPYRSVLGAPSDTLHVVT